MARSWPGRWSPWRPAWWRVPGSWPNSACSPRPHPRGVGEYIPADPTGLTAVPGVWVAGNVTDLTAQVGGAAAAGALAGTAINLDLVTEEAREAAAAPSEPSSSAPPWR